MTDQAEALLALLRGRRTIHDFLPDRLPDELIDRVLDAGRFAPNHKLTEPWRFTVLGPRTRDAVAGAWPGPALRKLGPDASDERREATRRVALDKWWSKPNVVVVTQRVDPDPDRREEDYAAVAAAIQNVQLAAWALGLGCQWGTSPPTRDPAVMQAIGIPTDERVVGFLFVGRPASVPEVRRLPLEAVRRWTP